MTKPDPRPGKLLALVWKLLQLWTKSPQNWQRNLFLLLVAILSTLYGIGSIPLSESKVLRTTAATDCFCSSRRALQSNHHRIGQQCPKFSQLLYLQPGFSWWVVGQQFSRWRNDLNGGL